MSYSFNVSAATKEALLENLTVKMNDVVAQQPCHAKDKDAAIAVAKTFIDMVVEDPEHYDLQLSMHGSVGWVYDATDPNGLNPDTKFTSAGVGVSVYAVTKPAAAA